MNPQAPVHLLVVPRRHLPSLKEAAAEDERKKLSAACDEANERRQSEVYALTLKLDAMRSRSTAAEKLLAEMRQNLVARTEEIRATEAKLVEAVLGRSGDVLDTRHRRAHLLVRFLDGTAARSLCNRFHAAPRKDWNRLHERGQEVEG